MRHYFEASEKLAATLDSFDGVWVIGGNTFILRRAMRYSGFDRWITAVDKGFVYGGYSAGVCVLPATLHGLEIIDDPARTPPGY